jgi:hypothetical protein
MQALGRQEKDALPGAVDDREFVGKSSSNSFGVMIGIIVAASCVFVFAILVVAVRLHRYGGSNLSHHSSSRQYLIIKAAFTL